MRVARILPVLALLMSCAATASITSTMIVEMREIKSVSVSPSGELAVIETCHSNPMFGRFRPLPAVVEIAAGGPVSVRVRAHSATFFGRHQGSRPIKRAPVRRVPQARRAQP